MARTARRVDCSNANFFALAGVRAMTPQTVVFIPTCKRPELLRALLSDLDGQPCRIVVFQDGDFPGYSEVFADYPGVFAKKYDVPHGRELYWQLVNDAFRYLKNVDFRHVIFLGDDNRVDSAFVDRAVLSLMVSGADALNLSDDGRAGVPQWGISYGGIVNGYHNTGWLDMCFVTSRKVMHLLEWSIYPVQRNWKPRVLLGSGVGKQISKRMGRKGLKIYQVYGSMVRHGSHKSVMNPERRCPLIAETEK